MVQFPYIGQDHMHIAHCTSHIERKKCCRTATHSWHCAQCRVHTHTKYEWTEHFANDLSPCTFEWHEVECKTPRRRATSNNEIVRGQPNGNKSHHFYSENRIKMSWGHSLRNMMITLYVTNKPRNKPVGYEHVVVFYIRMNTVITCRHMLMESQMLYLYSNLIALVATARRCAGNRNCLRCINSIMCAESSWCATEHPFIAIVERQTWLNKQQIDEKVVTIIDRTLSCFAAATPFKWYHKKSWLCRCVSTRLHS